MESQPQNLEFRNNPENSLMHTVDVLKFQTLFSFQIKCSFLNIHPNFQSYIFSN